jgi:hypothetical protein
VYASEYFVDGFVPVPPSPPAFNNACIVAMDDDIAANARERGKGSDKKLKAHSFSPPNVTLLIVGCLPSRDEPPGSPVIADDNSDTNS